MKYVEKMALVLSLALFLQALTPWEALGQEGELEPLWTPCCSALKTRPAPVLLAIDTPITREKKQGYSRLALSAALTLGAGALAYWSKERANKAYSSYLKSANTARQQKQYDRARRFDRMAGVALLSMEVGVVFTSYMLFLRR